MGSVRVGLRRALSRRPLHQRGTGQRARAKEIGTRFPTPRTWSGYVAQARSCGTLFERHRLRYGVGSVEFLSDQHLRQCPHVVPPARGFPQAPPHGYRPYLCVSASPDGGEWLPLTRREQTASGARRILVPSRCKLGGNLHWQRVGTYLDDTRDVYFIPWKWLQMLVASGRRERLAVSPEFMDEVVVPEIERSRPFRDVPRNSPSWRSDPGASDKDAPPILPRQDPDSA